MPFDLIHSNADKYSNIFSKKTTEFTLYFSVSLRKFKQEAFGYKLLDARDTASWSLPSRCPDPEQAGQLWPEDLPSPRQPLCSLRQHVHGVRLWSGNLIPRLAGAGSARGRKLADQSVRTKEKQ